MQFALMSPFGPAEAAASKPLQWTPLRSVDFVGSRLRPGRFVTIYSHMTPRFEHRAQDGFSLEHRTLDKAHAWQVSRSLDGNLSEPVIRGEDVGILLLGKLLPIEWSISVQSNAKGKWGREKGERLPSKRNWEREA